MMYKDNTCSHWQCEQVLKERGQSDLLESRIDYYYIDHSTQRV